MASTYLSRTQSASTTRTKFTFSCWVKIASTSGYRYIASSYASNDNRLGFYMHASYGFTCYARIQGADQALRINLAQHRDVNGWYHFVVKGDSTQSSQADRIKLYTNGVEVTDYQTDSNNNIGSSANFAFGTTGHTFFIGNYDGTQYMYDGSMSHMHFCDGYAYDPSAFGSTDSTTGEWKIKTSPSVSYGTNGFFLFKNDNAVTDRSGQGNNFTLGGGTLTKTEDNPSNIFCTINPLFVNDGGETNGLTNGNTRYYSNSVQSGQWNNMAGTLGASTGKYYWEVKYTELHNTGTIYSSSEGVASTDFAPANLNLGEGSRRGYGYGWLCSNRNSTSNTRYLKTVNGTATLTTDSNNTPIAVNDIVGIAFDADNGKLWFHKNGTYIDDLSGYVGNPSTGAYPYHTGMQTGIIYTPWGDVWQHTAGSDIHKEYNFGNGYFGTTAVSSAGTNASGNGIFEYDVPTGFTALSTKGLNE